MKQLFSTLLVLTLVISSVSAYAADKDDIKLKLDGEEVVLSEAPRLYNNRTMIPLRGFFEKMGATVDWNKATNQAIIKTEKVEVIIEEDEKYAIVNGQILSFDTPAKNFDGHIYVPVRFISESLGNEVFWDGATRTVNVESKQYVAKNGLPKLKSEDELIDLLNANERLNNYIFGNRFRHMPLFTNAKIALEDAAPMENKSASPDTLSGSADHSDTNTQVEGVGEGDITVTNGKYIATSSTNQLSLIEIADGTGKVVFQEQVGQYISELYITDDKLIVLTHVDDENSSRGITLYNMQPISTNTQVQIYDITGDKPVKKIDKSFEGYFHTSRLIDDNLYLVTDKSFFLYRDEPLEIDGILPKVRDNISGMVDMKKIDDIYYLPGYVTPNITNLASLNINSGASEFESYLGNCDTVYASKNAIYLAEQSYHYEISKEAEKFLPRYKTETNIYKFALDNGKIKYQTEGKVDGEIVNKYALDEYKDGFRIATTTGKSWDEKNPQENHLFILDNNLDEIGAVKNLAKGEKIYSVRFAGDRAYIVTFKNVDPLFVIDTADMKNPKLLGQLKIPGFSTYMHILDENHILGFGSDAFEKDGRTQTGGLKISLFDVTDPANPKEDKSEIIGKQGTYSELEYNPKALMISLKKGIFAFPIDVCGNTPYASTFSGAYVYNVNKDDFSYKGNILKSKKEDYGYDINRILYIGDYLYSVSNKNVIITKLGDMSKSGEIEIPELKKEDPLMPIPYK